MLWVTFIQKRPSSSQADKASRVYLAKAIKQFPDRDMGVTVFFRPRRSGNPYDDETLSPYPGNLAYLLYTAKTKAISIRTVKIN